MHAVGRRIQLLAADVFGAVDHLPLQVGEIDDVEIHQPDAPDAGRGQIQAQRRAQAAGADQQHFGVLQLELPFHADFGHDQVAAVAQDFVLRKRTASLARGSVATDPPAMLGTIESVSPSFTGVASFCR